MLTRTSPPKAELTVADLRLYPRSKFAGVLHDSFLPEAFFFLFLFSFFLFLPRAKPVIQNVHKHPTHCTLKPARVPPPTEKPVEGRQHDQETCPLYRKPCSTGWHDYLGHRLSVARGGRRCRKKKSPPDTDKPSKLGIPGQERKGLATLQQRIAKSKPCGCLLHGTVRFV